MSSWMNAIEPGQTIIYSRSTEPKICSTKAYCYNTLTSRGGLIKKLPLCTIGWHVTPPHGHWAQILDLWHSPLLSPPPPHIFYPSLRPRGGPWPPPGLTARGLELVQLEGKGRVEEALWAWPSSEQTWESSRPARVPKQSLCSNRCPHPPGSTPRSNWTRSNWGE